MKITKVKRNENGEITNVMLSNGKVVSFDEAIEMAKNKEIEDVNIAHRGDTTYLRSNPNGENDDNLDNLPTF